MSSKHRVLQEKYFRNSKYIQVVNQQVGCQDFKKYCDDNKDYRGQFDFMLNTFNTLIDLRNCFVCASDLKMIEKISKSQDIIGNYLYLDYNEETKETERRLVTKTDLYEDGLSGRNDSAIKRKAFLKSLDLPELLSTNKLLPIINTFLTYDEYKKAVLDLEIWLRKMMILI